MRKLGLPALLVAYSLLIISCRDHSPTEASKIADKVKETVKKNSPGTIKTDSGGYYMKAKIDDKAWLATHMMPDEDPNSSYLRIHGENGGDYMNFQLWKRGLEAGKKFVFDDEHVANLSLEEDADFRGGKSGEVEILKLDGKWIEGKFHFRATTSSSSKAIEVTHGFFRVPFSTDLEE